MSGECPKCLSVACICAEIEADAKRQAEKCAACGAPCGREGTGDSCAEVRRLHGLLNEWSQDRVRAERRAQDALDSPDHVWANQRRQLRRENGALLRQRSRHERWLSRALDRAEDALYALATEAEVHLTALPVEARERLRAAIDAARAAARRNY